MSDETSVGKVVRNCVDNGRMVESALRTHADRASEALAKVTPLPKEHWKATLIALADDTGAKSDWLWNSELRLAAERADDIGVRDERDAANADLYEFMLDTKAFVKDGRAGIEPRRVSLAGPTPKVPMDLVAYASSASESLRREDITLTGPLGMALDSKDLAGRLDQKIEATQEAIAKIKVELREAEAALADRDTAYDGWHKSYIANATAAEGLFRRAGLDDLADRVRPSTRRATGVEGPPEDEPEQPAADDDVVVEPA